MAQAMATDTKSSFEDPMQCVGTDMTKRAAEEGAACGLRCAVVCCCHTVEND